MELDTNTTIFVEKEENSNIYNVEIANALSRKKLADLKIEKITDIRFHVREIHTY